MAKIEILRQPCPPWLKKGVDTFHPEGDPEEVLLYSSPITLLKAK
jgi:hypothetical protein